MLAPATKKWEDNSDLERFQFLFFCDCCKKPIPSPEYKFNSGFRPKLLMSESQRLARQILWSSDHNAAMERANLEMFQNHLHRCEICNDHICGDCAWVCDELGGGVCCGKCLEENGYHGTRLCE